MAYQDDLNAFLAQNPGDTTHARFNAAQATPMPAGGDPLAQGGADPGTQAPAPAYAGLTGDPFQTALITSAQLTALRPKRRAKPAPLAPAPLAGLSHYLGG